MKKGTLSPPAVAEVVFDTAYLLFATIAGFYLLLQGNGKDLPTLYGVLTLILGFGDAFHLLPRIYSLCTGTLEQHIKSLGFGKMVTSITMTLFYVLLYQFCGLFYQIQLPYLLSLLVFCAAIVRVVLCLLPQNGWQSKTPSSRFAIYRNIPFFVLGAGVAAAFVAGTVQMDGQDGFVWMVPAIVLSFVFYSIVVLFAGKRPKLFMFMLPKTCAYIWIICMGFSLI